MRKAGIQQKFKNDPCFMESI
uniref:Uncharacterized protein n=1 Tax=Wuchereria bancrofti TaxID=6293 RepID=A0AAF5PUA1_WUCBA